MPPRLGAACALALVILSEARSAAAAAGGVRAAPPPLQAEAAAAPGTDHAQVAEAEMLALAFEREAPPAGEPPVAGLQGLIRRNLANTAAAAHQARCMHTTPRTCGPLIHPGVSGDKGLPVDDGLPFDHLHFLRATPEAPAHEGVLVCAPPKAGTTSLLGQLWRMYTSKETLKDVVIHNLPKEVLDVQQPIPEAIAAGVFKPSPDAPTRQVAPQRPLRVGFVRSPYTRTYSAWSDKLATCRKGRVSNVPFCIRLNKEVAEAAGMTDALTDDKPALTWLEFTQALVKIREAGKMHTVNGHFRPQVNLCRIDKIAYDLIAPAEAGFAGAQRIITRWLFPEKGANEVDRITASGRVLNSAARRGGFMKFENIWTKETIANINKAFADDLAVMPWYSPPSKP
eukprot:TRINITY_DN56411_c0_g1_i1.p2 TRINITY_DN56411_c0_g1~~TRINITY_DN56411_c0_g1_i1.p2  ORF type:complete len:428 (+),score=138.75 TRINITY_DN56411_c0_g1_i1:92-1285(+)